MKPEAEKQCLQIQSHRMRMGCFVFFTILLVFFEDCCAAHHRRAETGLQQDVSHRRYRAVVGQSFMRPCFECGSQHLEEGLSRAGEGQEGNDCPSWIKDCGRKFIAEANYSGEYTCFICGRRLTFHLQVVEKHSTGCLPEEKREFLLLYQGGNVRCPGLNCSDNTPVAWYKGNKSIPQKDGWVDNGSLYLRDVQESVSGEYFCDRQVIEGGVKWTIRSAVNITPIYQFTASYPPRIEYPAENKTEEVELGQPHYLKCEIYFPVELQLFNSTPEVHWYMHYNGNTNNTVPLPMTKLEQVKITAGENKVIQIANIEEVTPQHLNNRYTCSAHNTVGNSSVTFKLKKKIRVKWPSLVGYPFVVLVLVAGLGFLLRRRWLELQLIYRSHFQHDKNNGEEFDVLLSYVWGPTPAEAPLSGFDIDAEAHLYKHLLMSETEKCLEVLLPQVLEDQWGYRLCLLERDVLPGGVYTNDVILAIQQSRMLVCLLSPDYLSNSNAVFVLESGVQALLQNSNLKILLVWTSRASKPHIQPDPPLSNLVQRALRVLPSLDWTTGKSTQANKDFWRSLRKAMPTQKK